MSREDQRAVIVLPEPSEALQELCIDVSNGIVNPGKTSPPEDSFQLTLQTDDDFLIDESTTGIFAADSLSAGPFLEARVESTGDTVGELAELRIELKLKSALPDSPSFYLELPASVFYSPEANNPQTACAINSESFQACDDLVT